MTHLAMSAARPIGARRAADFLPPPASADPAARADRITCPTQLRLSRAQGLSSSLRTIRHCYRPASAFTPARLAAASKIRLDKFSNMSLDELTYGIEP